MEGSRVSRQKPVNIPVFPGFPLYPVFPAQLALSRRRIGDWKTPRSSKFVVAIGFHESATGVDSVPEPFTDFCADFSAESIAVILSACLRLPRFSRHLFSAASPKHHKCDKENANCCPEETRRFRQAVIKR